MSNTRLITQTLKVFMYRTIIKSLRVNFYTSKVNQMFQKDKGSSPGIF